MDEKTDHAQLMSATPVIPRWRDDPENAGLAKRVVEIGAFSQKTADETVDYLERKGRTQARCSGKRSIRTDSARPNLDTIGMKIELESFEKDIVDRILGGEIRTERTSMAR